MSTSSKISLGSLRQQCQEITDLENNGAVTDQAWNSFITNSYKKLYDMLVGAYGNDYYLANTYQLTTSNSQSYPLPDGTPSYLDTTGSTAAKFYKLIGVDLQSSGTPGGWLTLRRFESIERNRFGYLNSTMGVGGYTNLRYRVQGDQIYLAPVPQTGQVVQLWYVPAPTNLQYRLQGGITAASATINFLDTSGLAVGMSATGNGIPVGLSIASLGSTSIILTGSCTATNSSTLVSMWTDSTLIDGIAGWEQFVILDSALKAQGKQENDTSWIAVEREVIKKEIEAMAEGRDAGQAFHVSDVLGAGGVWGSDDYGGWSGSW